MVEIREAPVPVAHGWRGDGLGTPNTDRKIAERFSEGFVRWAGGVGYLPCRVLLSNGQTIIVRAKK